MSMILISVRQDWLISAKSTPPGESRLKGFRGDYYKLSMKRQHLFFRVAHTFFTI